MTIGIEVGSERFLWLIFHLVMIKASVDYGIINWVERSLLITLIKQR